ncbi:hypothetical protein [Streptomyces sp. NPDC060188]|uniref:hypothetical protein n=1 Tax=Streptomyces sp. NPDC060188 TaxID=3347068 RepID=UPI00365479E1
MPDGTVSPDRFDEFREHHTAGLGRNAIARAMGLPASVISRTAVHLGLDFDRSRIQAATAARLADLEERRALLAEDLVSDAEKLRQQMWEPTTVYAFGGKDNEYNEHTFGEAPAAEKRALMGTAGMAIDRSLKLAPREPNSGLDNAKSMLSSLGDALTALSRAEDERESEQAEGEQA